MTLANDNAILTTLPNNDVILTPLTNKNVILTILTNDNVILTRREITLTGRHTRLQNIQPLSLGGGEAIIFNL